VDDRALATSLAEGHLDGLLAAYDGYADRLFGYGFGLLGSEDAAIGAIRDALLIAHEQAGSLVDPTRLAPWLYALTRNECVRRFRHADGDDLDSEVATLALRHRLGPADIAAVVGVSADEITHRLRAVIAAPPADVEAADEPAAPASLRAQLADGAAPDAEDYRAALVRRAGPFADSGFPQPLDQRRISGGALAWSTAAAVLIAVALLVVLPGNGSTAGGTTLAALPGGVSSSRPALASLPQPAFGTGAAVPIPAASTLLPGGEVAAPERTRPDVPDAAPTASATIPRPPVAAPEASVATNPDGRELPAGGATVVSWYQNRTAPACPPAWTARQHATVLGVDPTRVTGVVGRWSDQGSSHPIVLQRSGREWIATVPGLPTGRAVSMVVQASTTDGRILTGDPQQLLYRCS
jgi:DNA-directed RNA polymerase specialized sigma24 family protein